MIKKVSIATLAMFLTSASPAMAISDAHSLYVNLELTLNSTTVGAVIQSISEQTGYEFSYDEALLNKKISNVFVNFKNEHIEKVLKEVFKNTGISYKIVNNRVFLKDNSVKKNVRTVERLIVNEIQQNKKKISGVIVDDEGTVLIADDGGKMVRMLSIQDNKLSTVLSGMHEPWQCSFNLDFTNYYVLERRTSMRPLLFYGLYKSSNWQEAEAYYDQKNDKGD